jgi:type II secretory pathway component GspD/PulD (secretin)
MNNLINPYTCNVFTMLRALILLFSLLVSAQIFAEAGIDASAASLPASDDIIHDGKISLSLRDVSIAEVMEMLSRSARVNILLSGDVEGEVSVNLYDVNVDEAIHSIATSGGYGVEKRKGSYFIVNRDEAGKNAAGGPTQLRTFKVQYSDAEVVSGILENHLSSYGQITTLPERRLLVVEDTPYFLDRIETLLKELDRQPKQILIKAQILEVGLKDSESFGLDWTKIFESGSRTIKLGTQGLSNPGSAGFFFDYLTDDATLILDALRTRDRLRTLATPKLLALEDREAETIIGDRLGYNVTTTIDNVTTTSTEFLESGVILKVRPSVDGQNRILLDIHPEVSTGSVSDDGIPNQNTTEVTTTMLVESGKTVFIGGLIKRSEIKTREGVPVLGDIPGLGLLFSNRAISSINTELVVLITPYILDNEMLALDIGKSAYVEEIAGELETQPIKIDEGMDGVKRFEDSLDNFKGKNNDAEQHATTEQNDEHFWIYE